MTGLTREELLALPAVISLATAARALDIGRTNAQELARTGRWPTTLLRLGNRYRVPTAGLLSLLEISIEGGCSPNSVNTVADVGGRYDPVQ